MSPLHSVGRPRLMTGPLVVVVMVMMMMMLSSSSTTVEAGAPSSGMTSSIISVLLRMHNSFRSRIKDASNMLKMRWDTNLEAEAASWVSKCHYEHHPEATRIYGENIYRSEFDWKLMQIVIQGLNSWNLESGFRLRDPSKKCCDTNVTLCCNEQQMIWAKTRRVGCAVEKCGLLTSHDKNYTNAWFMTCLYHPRGNIDGQDAFKKSGQCKDCPLFFGKCDRGLCDKLNTIVTRPTYPPSPDDTGRNA